MRDQVALEPLVSARVRHQFGTKPAHHIRTQTETGLPSCLALSAQVSASLVQGPNKLSRMGGVCAKMIPWIPAHHV